MPENRKRILAFFIFLVLSIAVGVLVWENGQKQVDSSTPEPTVVTTPQPKVILGGRVLATTDSTLSFELLNIPPRKTIILTPGPHTNYFKVVSDPAEASKLMPIQKTDIKVGDYISAVFPSAIDINSQLLLNPDSINLLPPPPITPNK